MRRVTIEVSRRKLILFRLLAMVLPVAIAFAIAEAALRHATNTERKRNEAAWDAIYAERPPLRDGLTRLMDMIKASEEPQLIYELRPGLSTDFMGATVSINHLGFRGKAFSPSTSNVLRIVGLGDSSLFGWGVDDEETYLGRLPDLLAERTPGVGWETLNTGVPGYNTVMEVVTLKRRCLRYKPDIVLLHHVSNDLDLPHFVTVRGSRNRPLGSYALDWIVNRGRRVPGASDGLYMRDPEDIPEKYRSMVGEEVCVAAIRELGVLRDTHGFHLVICTDRWAPKYLRRAADEIGAPLAELGVPSALYMSKKGETDPVAAGVVLSKKDDHYTAFGHQLIAEYIADLLMNDKEVLTRVEKRSSNDLSSAHTVVEQ